MGMRPHRRILPSGSRGGFALPLLAASLVIAPMASDAQQATAPAGAASCSGCHGPANQPSPIPTLEGRAPSDISAAMQDFRAGRRPATLMDRIVKGFTEEEIAAIAAHVSAPRR